MKMHGQSLKYVPENGFENSAETRAKYAANKLENRSRET